MFRKDLMAYHLERKKFIVSINKTSVTNSLESELIIVFASGREKYC
jgi:hypothetical protein